jgi:hypothetical protein
MCINPYSALSFRTHFLPCTSPQTSFSNLKEPSGMLSKESLVSIDTPLMKLSKVTPDSSPLIMCIASFVSPSFSTSMTCRWSHWCAACIIFGHVHPPHDMAMPGLPAPRSSTSCPNCTNINEDSPTPCSATLPHPLLTASQSARVVLANLLFVVQLASHLSQCLLVMFACLPARPLVCPPARLPA